MLIGIDRNDIKGFIKFIKKQYKNEDLDYEISGNNKNIVMFKINHNMTLINQCRFLEDLESIFGNISFKF